MIFCVVKSAFAFFCPLATFIQEIHCKDCFNERRMRVEKRYFSVDFGVINTKTFVACGKGGFIIYVDGGLWRFLGGGA